MRAKGRAYLVGIGLAIETDMTNYSVCLVWVLHCYRRDILNEDIPSP